MTDVPFELRHEADAEGVVAAVFADIRRRMTFVPAIFKALAVDPEALERGWLQARTLVDHPGFADATERLRSQAAPSSAPTGSPGLAEAVAPFVAELPGMLLVVSSLGLALDGRIPLRAPPPLGLDHDDTPPEPIVPELHDHHQRYDDVRALYGTAHVPTLYRALAAHGLLDEAWATVEEVLTGEGAAERVERLAASGEDEALGLADWGCFDARHLKPVLAQFRIALPRNLLVAVALETASAAPR
ncbi:MAG TPA: hypothetical protein VMK83_11780 [Gaiellaceae bacterium]|nr:hypothetical protein [Gaiellaceae bacterium]